MIEYTPPVEIKKKRVSKTATTIFICPVCRVRWQKGIDYSGVDYYDWDFGGDMDEICPYCSIQQEIDSIPDCPVDHPDFERKYLLIIKQKSIKKGYPYA